VQDTSAVVPGMFGMAPTVATPLAVALGRGGVPKSSVPPIAPSALYATVHGNHPFVGNIGSGSSRDVSSRIKLTAGSLADDAKDTLFSVVMVYPPPVGIQGLVQESGFEHEDAVTSALATLEAHNPTANPAYSHALVGRWKLVMRSGYRFVPNYVSSLLADLDDKTLESVYVNIKEDLSVQTKVTVRLAEGVRTRTMSSSSLLIRTSSSTLDETGYVPTWITGRELKVTYIDEDVLVWRHTFDRGFADKIESEGIAEVFTREIEMEKAQETGSTREEELKRRREQFVQQRLQALYLEGKVNQDTVSIWAAELLNEWDTQHRDGEHS